jgi:hypothetical protein
MLSIGTLALLAPLQLTAPLQPLPDGTVRASGPALAALDGRLELDFSSRLPEVACSHPPESLTGPSDPCSPPISPPKGRR